MKHRCGRRGEILEIRYCPGCDRIQQAIWRALCVEEPKTYVQWPLYRVTEIVSAFSHGERQALSLWQIGCAVDARRKAPEA